MAAHSRWESILRWLAAWVGVGALLAPALSFSAPGLAAQWTTVELATAVVPARAQPNAGAGAKQPSAAEVLRDIGTLRRQWASWSGQSQASLPWSYRMVVAVPIALLLAGLCALLLLLAIAARWRAVIAPTAAVGLIASGYAIVAAALLTRSLHREIIAAALRAQRQAPLLPLFHLGTRLGAAIHVRAEAGAYLMLAAFAALLLLPATGARAAPPPSESA